MKKVINITLGSVVFAIEQDAYEALATYLEQIKNSLIDNDDAREIIDDIERALAEKFVVRKRNEKLAITSADVAAVVIEMGSPAEFGEGGERKQDTSEASAPKESSAEPKKRLYRDPDNAVIAGIASGLARYFDIDPVMVRLIFVISIFFNGLGVLAYIILWLVVPVAETTADKYAMRGERVTLKEISERVKKNIKNIEKTDYKITKGAWANLHNFLDTFFRVLGKLVNYFMILARYVLGGLLVVGGAFAMAGMVALYSIILLSERVFFPQEMQIAIETMQSSTLGIVAMASLFIMLAIPLIVFIITGASLLAKRNFFTIQKAVLLTVIWIIAAVLAGTTSALQAEQVMQKIDQGEGRFDDSNFEMHWDYGMDHDDDHYIRYSNEEAQQVPLRSN